MTRPRYFAALIVMFALLQVLSATYFLRIPNFYAIDSFIFMVSGIGIAICVLMLPAIHFDKGEIFSKQLAVKLLCIAILLPVSYMLARQIMDNTPLQYQDADMLPVIKVMDQRFLHGQWKTVYQPIPEIWNGIRPIYLPALWLPFSLSSVFHFDVRWTTVCGIWLSVILCVLPLWKKGWEWVVCALALLLMLAWLHTDDDNSVIELTEEGVVFFYYALLAVAIAVGNPWLLGVSIGLSLLSRYSFVGWVPFAFGYLLIKKKYRFIVTTSASAAAVVLILVILPFGFHPLLLHFHLHEDYIGQAVKVWNANPEFYYEGLGMAKFFGPDRIRLLHSILQYGTFLVPLVFLFIIRRRIIPQSNVLLAGLQLSLTFFYNFLDVTYLYLFYTPVIVSMVIASLSITGPKDVSVRR